MPTNALYRDDFYLATAEGTVTRIHDDGAIELDQTCFYATSGGQPGDMGLFERADGSKIESIRVTGRASDTKVSTNVHTSLGGLSTGGSSFQNSALGKALNLGKLDGMTATSPLFKSSFSTP